MITAHSEGGEFADAICPKATPLAISGGSVVDEKGGTVLISAPISGNNLSSDGQKPTGWRVRANSGAYTSYAVCAQGGSGAPEEPEGEPKK